MIAEVRVLCAIYFTSVTSRFWDGSGPYIDDDGELWRQGNLVEGGLDAIEQAINGEAFTLVLGLSGLDKATADLAWEDYQNGEIIGSKVQILTQDFDGDGLAIGGPKVRFTGKIDDIDFDDAASDDMVMSTVKVSVVNRFTIRNLVSGSVLSDINQKARSKYLNPLAVLLDRACERIAIMIDKTIRWPNW